MTPRQRNAQPTLPLENDESKARQPIRGQLMRYIEQRPGVRVYLETIMKELEETEPRRVQQGILNMRNDGKLEGHIEIVIAGRCWIWHPEEATTAKVAPGRRLFEEVGKTKDGGLVLEADDATLWKATQL